MLDKSLAYYNQSRPEILSLVPQFARRVLDVGCGSGAFGDRLGEERPECEVFGIEISQEAAAAISARYKKVWIGDANQSLAQLAPASFDCIVFNDILEHLVDPWDCLEKALPCLAKDGVVIASIPNMRFWPTLSDLLFQCDWRYRDAGVMDETHLRYFTKRSMARMFEDCGFRVESITGINKTWIISWRWRLLNLMMLNKMEDCLYPQFAVVASKNAAE